MNSAEVVIALELVVLIGSVLFGLGEIASTLKLMHVTMCKNKDAK